MVVVVDKNNLSLTLPPSFPLLPLRQPNILFSFLTYNHGSEFKPFLDWFSMYLVGKIGKSYISQQFLSYNRNLQDNNQDQPHVVKESGRIFSFFLPQMMRRWFDLDKRSVIGYRWSQVSLCNHPYQS